MASFAQGQRLLPRLRLCSSRAGLAGGDLGLHGRYADPFQREWRALAGRSGGEELRSPALHGVALLLHLAAALPRTAWPMGDRLGGPDLVGCPPRGPRPTFMSIPRRDKVGGCWRRRRRSPKPSRPGKLLWGDSHYKADGLERLRTLRFGRPSTHRIRAALFYVPNELCSLENSCTGEEEVQPPCGDVM